MSGRDKVEGVVLIPEPVEKSLNERELVSYRKYGPPLSENLTVTFGKPTNY